jgi:hypothetical protein
MPLPPLLASRPANVQVALGVGVPAVFGLVTGLVLGVSEAGYLVLSLLGIAGGWFAGLEHRDAEEGFVRGVTGGLLFGTFILFGNAFSGMEAKAHLPEPEILLVLITTAAGAVLGALGGRSRARRTRREREASAAEAPTAG